MRGHYDAEMRRSLGHSQPEAQHKGSLDLSKSSDIGKSVISKNTLAVAGWGTWEPSIKCIKDVWMAAGAHGNH